MPSIPQSTASGPTPDRTRRPGASTAVVRHLRITLVSAGTRGDVQPYVALGMGLQAAGHSVAIATHASFEPFVRGHGLRFREVHGNPQEMLRVEARRPTRTRGPITRLLPDLRFLRHQVAPILEAALRDCWTACEDADLVVANQLGLWLSHHVVETIGVPLIRAYTWPGGLLVGAPGSAAMRAVPLNLSLGRRVLQLPRGLNPWLIGLTRRLVWGVFRSRVNAARQRVFGLRPLPLHEPFADLERKGVPLLFGYSPAVFPRPRDWGHWIHVTGYWFLDHPPDWQPPPDLLRFLEAGPPPVFIGFGSTIDRDAPEANRLVVNALARTGQRALLGDGVGQGELPPQVFPVSEVPFDWLFPRVAAVVHHGGAGTTGASLRAGVPSVTVPFFADQPFWSEQVRARGAAPPPIPRSTLTAERLASAIQQATSDPSMRRRAAALGARIRAEDGVARAVELITHL